MALGAWPSSPTSWPPEKGPRTEHSRRHNLRHERYMQGGIAIRWALQNCRKIAEIVGKLRKNTSGGDINVVCKLHVYCITYTI